MPIPLAAPQVQIQQPATNTGVTLTLPAPGAGLFHYIESIRISRACNAALAGTAALSITTTNLGGRAWMVGNAMAAGGTQLDVAELWPHALRSAVANTATTIVLPAPGVAVQWTVEVVYFVGPSIADWPGAL
jgi:hypothetical protein